MWQTKYASAVPMNLGLGFDFRPCSEGDFPVVRGLNTPSVSIAVLTLRTALRGLAEFNGF